MILTKEEIKEIDEFTNVFKDRAPVTAIFLYSYMHPQEGEKCEVVVVRSKGKKYISKLRGSAYIVIPDIFAKNYAKVETDVALYNEQVAGGRIKYTTSDDLIYNLDSPEMKSVSAIRFLVGGRIVFDRFYYLSDLKQDARNDGITTYDTVVPIENVNEVLTFSGESR